MAWAFVLFFWIAGGVRLSDAAPGAREDPSAPADGALAGRDVAADGDAAADAAEGVEGGGGDVAGLGAELAAIDAETDPPALAAALAPPRPARKGKPVPDAIDPTVRARADRLLAITRALERIGTTPALREAIAAHPRLAAAMLPELHRLVGRVGERAVPALLEARLGPAPAVRAWADKELERLNKSAVAEAVQTADERLLVDVLEAYGRAGDAQAVPALVSFAAADRRAVREAARGALRAMGDGARGALRDAYRAYAGRPCPADWDQPRTLDELLALLDASRLADAYRLVDEGLAAEQAGDFGSMAARFDEALAREPRLARGREMVRGYLALARATPERERARSLLDRALRLSQGDPDQEARVQAEMAFLDAEQAARAGYEGASGYERVLALDPQHEGARRALTALAARRSQRWRQWAAYGAASVAVAAALAAILLLLVRRARTLREAPPRG